MDDKEAKAAVDDLANMLLRPIDAKNDRAKDGLAEKGFAGATFVVSGKSAVSVESVSCPKEFWY